VLFKKEMRHMINSKGEIFKCTRTIPHLITAQTMPRFTIRTITLAPVSQNIISIAIFIELTITNTATFAPLIIFCLNIVQAIKINTSQEVIPASKTIPRLSIAVRLELHTFLQATTARAWLTIQNRLRIRHLKLAPLLQQRHQKLIPQLQQRHLLKQTPQLQVAQAPTIHMFHQLTTMVNIALHQEHITTTWIMFVNRHIPRPLLHLLILIPSTAKQHNFTTTVTITTAHPHITPQSIAHHQNIHITALTITVQQYPLFLTNIVLQLLIIIQAHITIALLQLLSIVHPRKHITRAVIIIALHLNHHHLTPTTQPFMTTITFRLAWVFTIHITHIQQVA
jgi:hypothetical protein